MKGKGPALKRGSPILLLSFGTIIDLSNMYQIINYSDMLNRETYTTVNQRF